MTTIAFDGRTMAADTQQSGDFIDQFRAPKIVGSKDRRILTAGAGRVSSIERLRAWFFAGADLALLPQLEEKDDSTLLIVQGGKVFELDREGFLIEVGAPYAIGTGAKFAMGAMLAGADARQAVRIAIKLDPDSGGRIAALKVKGDPHVTDNQLSAQPGATKPNRKNTRRRRGKA